ncbi:MAG: class I SAM-dependent methyltransferase [Mesorhizobium sp.]|uniref:class I SAM-dependent methyltransferase n=1 Tax=Mesorhizobium sp. TaxID=1871066 RepID=UPI000FE81A5C|nr:methyltransferase domain-containing protein [Mesorhizobium sp.]RWM05662.1 MAG: methyltransferase domain-containing protein [Mesorhizobium sp.]TIO49372.1 MAG: class I SAM-dependent methyltransferase [Mesorhizobium sp.]TIO57324.1 MAG: class I SAM-dependent methyltransferase [Mesorhizobium sp.]TJV59765.1 MAG: class I SAM-dependent methyltransferase [Mesorhizobium sp.]
MDEPFYKTAAIGYDELFARATNSFIPSLLRAARIAPGHRVLDVATGTGAAAQAAAMIAGASGSVIGGDISPSMLESAKRNLKDQPISLVSFDAHALPYEDCQFDAVICQLGPMFFFGPDCGAFGISPGSAPQKLDCSQRDDDAGALTIRKSRRVDSSLQPRKS